LSSSIPEQGVRDAGSLRLARRRAWIFVGLMMACILLSLPTTPGIWQAALETLGPRFDAVGYVVVVVVFAALLIHAARRGAGMAVLFAAIGFGPVYFYLLKYQCQYPAERLHLIEYGLLAYLSYKALRLDLSEMRAYVSSFFIASGFGFFDEAVQYVLPDRVFEVRDAVTNVLAAAVGLMVVRVLLRPGASRDSFSEVER